MSLLNIIDIKKWKIIFKNSAEIECGHVFFDCQNFIFHFKKSSKMYNATLYCNNIC